MTELNVLVQVDKTAKREMKALAQDLTDHGMTIQNTLAITGIISGHADSKSVDAMRQVKGVASVREEGTFELPPVDKDVPQ